MEDDAALAVNTVKTDRSLNNMSCLFFQFISDCITFWCSQELIM